MYACGPTVYGFTHVGNARPTIFFDVIRRFLEFRGFEVTFVSNFTDVDDRIINRAREEKTTSHEVSERFTIEFIKDRNRMGVQAPTYSPKVTEHIPDIIALIARLIANGTAYTANDGEVLYAVRQFKDYGKLSKKRLDDLRVGVRIDPNESKSDPLDFSLWKPQKAADEPAWDSPWGKGRPGWHIECSAMAMRYLGETFDIHGGGLDLIHPHHENEIAQSEGATRKPFANFWLHNNLVTIDSKKMSKSVGNIFLNREFMDKYHPETLRFLILANHYRSTIDFSHKHISECQAALHRVYTCLKRVSDISESSHASGSSPPLTALKQFGETFQSSWVSAMEDDFNTAKVMGLVFDYVRLANTAFEPKKYKPSQEGLQLAHKMSLQFKVLGNVLNLFIQEPKFFLNHLRTNVAKSRDLEPSEIDRLVAKRSKARANKDYATSDAIRQELLKKGIEIRDSGNSSEWDVGFYNS